MARVTAPEDCYVVQYVRSAAVPGSSSSGSSGSSAAAAAAPSSSSSSALSPLVPAAATAALAEGSASMTFRFVGRCVLDAERSAVQSFDYAPELPTFLSRLLTVRSVPAAALAAAAAATAAAAGSAAPALPAAAAAAAAATGAEGSSDILQSVIVLGEGELEVELCGAVSAQDSAEKSKAMEEE